MAAAGTVAAAAGLQKIESGVKITVVVFRIEVKGEFISL